ncbi:MAG: PilZ domain-containing protein [Krumholzibacteria bacterium]|nr:PilZ domain-containing protein [Candidatus Krumholzibacteria bacterium]
MLLETLKALTNAGRDALQTACGLAVTAESVSQLEQGGLTFPALGDLVITGGSLNRVHLGADSGLCRRLAQLDDPAGGCSGTELLARAFLGHLLEEIPGRRPRGRFAGLAVEPLAVRTRGVRTFGFRFVTAAGQFFLLAEVPSRLEWELAKGTDFLTVMAESYLPDGWATRNALAGPLGVENFLVFLRKVEADTYLFLPTAGGAPRVVCAFLVEQCSHEGDRALKFALKLPDQARELPFPGTEVEGRVGVGERSVEFTTRYLGRTLHPVGGGAMLQCGLFSVPGQLAVLQRRGTFRIPIEEPIPVDLALDDDEGGSPWRRRHERRPGRLVLGSLADLSFSGARVTLDRNEAPGCAVQGQRITCNVHLPGVPERLRLAGIVRRVATVRVEHDDPCEELGIEFLPAAQQGPGVLDRVRDFVLAEQRAWLARRIQVAGVGEW